MATGDKKRVLMQTDIGTEGGVAPSGYGYGEVPELFSYETEEEMNAALHELLETMENGEARQIRIRNHAALGYTGQIFLGTLYRYTKDDGKMWGALSCFAVVGNTSDIAYISKTCAADVWTPWEHSNPPMRPNEEYRTTERLNGKPLYCKYITGAQSAEVVRMPINEANIHHVWVDMTRSFYSTGTAGNNLLTDTSLFPRIYVNQGEIVLYCDISKVGVGAGYLHFIVWYDKLEGTE